jgi:hypothetical protein
VDVKDILYLISRLNDAQQEEKTCAHKLRQRLALAITGFSPTHGIQRIQMLKDRVLAGLVCLDVISHFSSRGQPGLGRIYADAFEATALDFDGVMPSLGWVHLAVMTKQREYLESALRFIRGTQLERRCLSLACIILCREELEHHQILLMQAKCELKQDLRELQEANCERKPSITTKLAKEIVEFCENVADAPQIVSGLERLLHDPSAGKKQKDQPPN